MNLLEILGIFINLILINTNLVIKISLNDDLQFRMGSHCNDKPTLILPKMF